MRVFRRHLRTGAATWLVCHVLAFSALLPRDCCAAHAHAGAAAAAVDHSAHGMPADADHAQHATAPATVDGAYCPMAAADGAPCPMHDGSSDVPATCQMTGICNQPAAALAAVLIQGAIPPPTVALLAPLTSPLRAATVAGQPRSLATPPDSPPPRL